MPQRAQLMHFMELPFSFPSHPHSFICCTLLPLSLWCKEQSQKSQLFTDRDVFAVIFHIPSPAPSLGQLSSCSLGQTIHGGLFCSLSYSWSCSVYVCVHACVPVIKLLEIPDPFYCSFDPHPWRHEGQSGAPRQHVQVLSVCMKVKEDKGEENVKDKYYQEMKACVKSGCQQQLQYSCICTLALNKQPQKKELQLVTKNQFKKGPISVRIPKKALFL